VRAALLAAWDAQDMPFQKLVEELAPLRAPGLPPLCQLGFNYLDIGFSRRRVISAEDDLTLEVSGGEFRVEYATALFDAATAERVADAFATLLSTALADPGTPLAAGTPRTAEPAGEPEPAGYVAPRTAAEELVAEVWGNVLGRAGIGALDDFFDLGGHSLLALRVLARLSAAAGAELPVQDFFADTTVAGVAGALERILAAELDELSDDEAARLVAGNGQDA
jgi:non-ribosomal peptide synthetase component F